MNVPTNKIAPTEKVEKGVAEYQSNGETIKLSPTIIRKYLVSGGGNVSDQEVMMFLMLCKSQHLNPFLREAYLIKYGERNPATIVVGKDVFLKRARRQKDYAGFEAGIIIYNSEGKVEERNGTYYDKETETLMGGWAKVYINGYTIPVYASVNFDEYVGRKSDGTINGQWNGKPATMIRKVALCQALREAFPEDFGGLYSQEEMTNVSGEVLDDTAVEIPEEPKAPKRESEPEPEYNPALEALMGDEVNY